MFKLFKKMPRWLRKTIAITFLVTIAISLIVVLFIGILFVGKFTQHAKENADRNSTYASIVEQLPDRDVGAIKDPLYSDINGPLYSDKEFSQSERLDSAYRVDFVDVGYGDCTVLSNGAETMVVDTGDAFGGKLAAKHLRTNGISRISVLVVTNESNEHIGGLSLLLHDFEVDTLIVPNANTENEVMKTCIAFAKENGVEVKTAKALDAWNIGQAQVQILSAKHNVIIRIGLQATSFLLMSDASLEEEMALLELDIDVSATVLKASSHGSANTSSSNFLKWIAPKYAVVSCDKTVATPNVKTLNRLYETAVVYRTDKFGTVSVLSDGCEYALTVAKL